MLKSGRLLTLAIVLWGLPGHGSEAYTPPRGSWEQSSAEKAGFDSRRLAAAVEFAQAHESSHPRDFANQEKVFGRRLGPIPSRRSGTKGLIVKGGRIVAEWGDTRTVEPTYSAAKSFLSTVAGVAVDRGFIDSVNGAVGKLVKDGGYDSPQNSKVTWAHHLTQSSEWEGTLWDKSWNFLDRVEFGDGAMRPRELQEPGSRYEYNDVRVNRLALSLLRVFGKPLPDVLRAEIMDPIGASSGWKWLGYANSYVDLNGRRVQSVTGGTRWGGGLWISAEDQARFGLLMLRKGLWGKKRVVSSEWIEEATSPSATKSDYGYMWWLNTGRKAWPALSEKAFAAVGYGSNTIWVDPERDLVVVWRWHDSTAPEFLRRIVAAQTQ